MDPSRLLLCSSISSYLGSTNQSINFYTQICSFAVRKSKARPRSIYHKRTNASTISLFCAFHSQVRKRRRNRQHNQHRSETEIRALLSSDPASLHSYFLVGGRFWGRGGIYFEKTSNMKSTVHYHHGWRN